MHIIFSVVIVVFALSACSPQEADSTTGTEKRGTKSVPSASDAASQNNESGADALGEEFAVTNDFAVDEPLPPFDEGFDGIPELVARGEFVGIAPSEAVGQVQLYAISDGSYLLRLENLRVSNDVDLQLRLRTATAAIKLGALKGTSGNQNYLIEPTKAKGFTALEIYSAQTEAATVAQAVLTK